MLQTFQYNVEYVHETFVNIGTVFDALLYNMLQTQLGTQPKTMSHKCSKSNRFIYNIYYYEEPDWLKVLHQCLFRPMKSMDVTVLHSHV